MKSRKTFWALLWLLPAWAQASSPPSVKLVPAQPVQSVAKEVVNGQLAPSKMLPLGFEVGGRIASVRVAKGEVVKAGQLLATLNTEIIDAQVAQAEAGVMAAESASALAADVAERNQKLKEEGGVTEIQLKQMGTQAKAALAQLRQAEAGLAQARAGQRRHYLRAPFAGTLIDAPDQAGGMTGPGHPVFVLMQLDPLVLRSTVPEQVRGQLKPGLKVRVDAVGSQASTSEATVKAVLPSADPATRRVPIEIWVPNPDGRFVANALARATLPVSGDRAAVVVPATALGSAGGDHVFTVEGGVLKRVPVEVAKRSGARVTVVPEAPVQQVVDYPTAALTDGLGVTQR